MINKYQGAKLKEIQAKIEASTFGLPWFSPIFCPDVVWPEEKLPH
jgi:hypothetical protein